MSGEKQNIPNRREVAVVGLGSPTPVDRSECVGGFVEVEGDGEVLGVGEDHHVEKGQEHHSIHAIEEPGFPSEHSWPWHIPEVPPVGQGQSHPKTFPMCASWCGLGDWFPRSRAQQGGRSKGR